jgi:rfaE bifunctional protein kinase chain/domain
MSTAFSEYHPGSFGTLKLRMDSRENKTMLSLADRFRPARILVVGDVMLDEYVVGAVSRICPEAPVPVLDVRSRYASPGGAANVAMNVVHLGASVDLVGLAGEDAAGKTLCRLLREHSILSDFLLNAGERGTISKTRIVAGQQQICRIDHEIREEIETSLQNSLTETIRARLPHCTVVVLSDYAKGLLTETLCREVIAYASSLGKPVIVDPKAQHFGKYSGCTVITPNLSEASLASGVSIQSSASLEQAGAKLMEQLPSTSVLITRGPEGMALFEHNQEPVTIPTTARKVFDVVGAGDTAVATLAVALAAGFPLREAVVWSNLAAGIVVEKPGTAFVSVEELVAAKITTHTD